MKEGLRAMYIWCHTALKCFLEASKAYSGIHIEAVLYNPETLPILSNVQHHAIQMAERSTSKLQQK